MKGYFISGLIFFSFNSLLVFGATYLQNYPYGTTYYQRPILRQTYNPYSSYSSYNSYNRANLSNKQRTKRIQKMQKARKINRIKRNLSSYLSGIGNKNYNQGVMTGYSVPINQNVFSQVGIYPRNYNNAINQPSSFSNCNTDLFSMPSGNELYYTDGRFFRNSGGLEGKTGVKIIYD